MKHNNITEKLTDELKTLSLGVSLLREELKSQSRIDATIISNKSKEFLNMIHSNVGHIARDFIPEQIDHNKEESVAKIRNANQKIRELELQLGTKVAPSDICHCIKGFEQQIKTAFEKHAVYTGVSVSFNEYSIIAELKYIKQNKKDSSYARSQEEIDENKKYNDSSSEIFLSHFDVADSNVNEMSMILTERNIDMLKQILKDSGLNFTITNLETDEFEKDFSIINKMVITQDIQNISLQFPTSIYK